MKPTVPVVLGEVGTPAEDMPRPRREPKRAAGAPVVNPERQGMKDKISDLKKKIAELERRNRIQKEIIEGKWSLTDPSRNTLIHNQTRKILELKQDLERAEENARELSLRAEALSHRAEKYKEVILSNGGEMLAIRAKGIMDCMDSLTHAIEKYKRKKSRSPRMADIVECRASGMTLQAIGERWGLSRERVRQICMKSYGRKENKDARL